MLGRIAARSSLGVLAFPGTPMKTVCDSVGRQQEVGSEKPGFHRVGLCLAGQGREELLNSQSRTKTCVKRPAACLDDFIIAWLAQFKGRNCAFNAPNGVDARLSVWLKKRPSKDCVLMAKAVALLEWKQSGNRFFECVNFF